MQLEELEAKIDLDKLLPELIQLVADAAKALSDGKLSLAESIRLGQGFLRLVKKAVR